VAGQGTVTRHRGTAITSYGALRTAFVDGHLLAGQGDAVQSAIDLAAGRGQPLSGAAVYRRAVDRQPPGRFAEIYASRDGVRRLLAPQGGLLGGAGVLLDQPGLLGTDLAFSAHGSGVQVSIRASRDAKLAARSRSPFRSFQPSLLKAVPRDALAYIGVRGLDGALARLLGAAVPNAGGLGSLLAGLRDALGSKGAGESGRELARILAGETAIVLTPATPVPVLTVLAPAPDEARARAALRRLKPPHWAVFDGRVAISTSPDGIARVRRARASLADAPRFQAVLGNRPKTLTSIVFLDFSELLRLGEQTGLSESPAYRAVRGDLERVRAIGATSAGGEADTTAELFLQIS
jgi:hypothetical protein